SGVQYGRGQNISGVIAPVAKVDIAEYLFSRMPQFFQALIQAAVLNSLASETAVKSGFVVGIADFECESDFQALNIKVFNPLNVPDLYGRCHAINFAMRYFTVIAGPPDPAFNFVFIAD